MREIPYTFGSFHNKNYLELKMLIFEIGLKKFNLVN